MVSHQTIYSEKSALGDLLTDCSINRVMAFDPEWKIIFWNRTAEAITGLDRHAVLGHHLTEIFPAIADDPEIMTAIENAFAGFKSFLPSAPNKFNRHYVENHFIPLWDKDDRFIGVMNIMHDVAHRLKAEQELARLNDELEKKYQQLQEANHSLAAFTNIASLEIQEPVRSIYTGLELLAQKEGTALTQWSRGNLRKMQASLNRINLLLADLLSISTISQQEEKSDAVDLNDLLNNLITKMAAKIDAKGACVTVKALPTVKGYPQMLTYLFHHLIDNSLKFQPQQQPAEVIISAETDNSTETGFLKINCTDNGIGFHPSESTKIFGMFERLLPEKYKGSGIGLALCKKIMDLHEGEIHAHGDPGKGATISCLFPTGEHKLT